MASKIKVTRQKVEMLEKEGPETPLLDLSDAAVKALIRSAKKRAYVTHDQRIICFLRYLRMNITCAMRDAISTTRVMSRAGLRGRLGDIDGVRIGRLVQAPCL